MNRQIANYTRGKFVEILIVGAATYVTFTILGMDYAALLGLIVGLSVLGPFIGAALVKAVFDAWPRAPRAVGAPTSVAES